MKIIAIMGSPKGKGSGYRIVRKIEDMMKTMGEVEFQYLFLKDANLKPCTGCYTCMATGEDHCPLQDDRATIEQTLLAADGVILSSPVHVANVSGLMKNFIDRFAYRNHRPQFFRQKVLTVVNMAGTDRASLRYTVGGSQIVHELAIQTPPWPQTERAVAKKERAIRAAAEKFYKACLDTALPKPTFSRYLNFLLMQKLSAACRSHLPKDYEFYNGKSYYYATNINAIKVAAARLIARVMASLMRDVGPGDVPWPGVKKRDRGAEQ
jgi:multimeric flavodoxin WrbA